MIAIKDMEMPKSCADCERGSICGYGLGYSRADDCPLVEIGIDIGDKDECAIYEYKGAKE